MTNPPPDQDHPVLRPRWLAVGGFLAAGSALLLAIIFRRRPSEPALRPILVIEPESSQPALVVSPPEDVAEPVPVSPLRWFGFLLALVVVSVGLIALQDSAPGIAAGLFVALLAFSAVVFLRNHPDGWRGVLSGVGLFLLPLFQIARALVYFHWQPRFHSEAKPGRSADTPSTFLSVMVSLAIGCGLILVLLFLAYAPLVGVSVGVLLVGVGVIAKRLQIDVFILPRLSARTLRAALPLDSVEIEVLSRRKLAAEMTFILLVVLFFTRQFYTTDADLHLTGGEAEWLTASAYTAHDGLQREGRIPLWQPYLEFGEPLVENPFSFIMNPFSGGPSLLLDAATGIKISIVLTALLASVGGWFLARMLGLSTLGRLLLAMLLLGKGNMFAMINTGYYQLGIGQAYFPWVIGGVMAILRFPRKRWPVALTAVSMTLLYFVGNLWYVLPTAVSVVLLALVYVIRGAKGRFDWFAARRFLLTAVLVVGLSAVTLIPLVVNFNRIKKHLPQVEAGWVMPLWNDAIPLYTTSDPYFLLNLYNPENQTYEDRILNDFKPFYYSFTVPLWYLALILVAIPLYRPSSGRTRRFWVVGALLLILATSWGAGGQPLFLWLYAHVPLMSQWRFVGRAFAIGSFWLAVFVAMRADTLRSYITTTDWGKLGLQPRLARFFPLILSGVLVVGSVAAGWEVNINWNEPSVHPMNPTTNVCITWLRQTYPRRPLAVWQALYLNVTTYINNHVRNWDIRADFEMSPLPPTVGSARLDLTNSMPEFGLAVNPEERQYFTDQNFDWIRYSPLLEDGFPCLFRLPDALPYMYTIPLAVIEAFRPATNELTRLDFPDRTITPVETYMRNEDNITIWLSSNRNYHTVLTLQERAYPGWRVEVDGQPAQIESVGGQIGVVLPPGYSPVTIYFEYRPPLLLLGGVITLLTSAFCTAYLLLPLRRKRSR